MHKAKRVLWLLLILVMPGGGAAQPVDIPPAVGRISYGDTLVPGAAICTGVLVAADLVLTAGHCVRGAADDPSSIRFEAGWRNGHPAIQGRGRRWFCPDRRIWTRMLPWSCWTAPSRPRWPRRCRSPPRPRRRMRCTASGAMTLSPRPSADMPDAGHASRPAGAGLSCRFG